MGTKSGVSARQQEQIRSLRRALKAVLYTHGSRSEAARKSVSQGHEAYRNAFSEEEMAKVLEHARKVQQEAPEGHFLRQAAEIVSFEQAIDDMGTQLIDQALGEQA